MSLCLLVGWFCDEIQFIHKEVFFKSHKLISVKLILDKSDHFYCCNWKQEQQREE